MEYTPSSEEGFTGEIWSGINKIPGKHYSYGEDYYFDSYAHYSVHENMLKDAVRTETYKNAIMNHAYRFKDKVILDVGCGTGILSLFAAKAGASKVYAVDSSDIIDFAMEIARQNEVEICFIKGTIETIELPEKVDVIISEWMGFFLLYESMLQSVIFARDKWLKPGGYLFPSKARLWLAAFEDTSYKFQRADFWNNLYHINMQSMRKASISEPIIDDMPRSKLVSSASPILDIDLATVTCEDLHFTSSFSLFVQRKAKVTGFVGWFEVGFFACHRPVILSTSPMRPSTHWRQAIFMFDRFVFVSKGEKLQGSIALRPRDPPVRSLDIKILYRLKQQYKSVQFFRIR